jgi:hypothetical protein
MGGWVRGCGFIVALWVGSHGWARPIAVVNFDGSVGYGIAPDEELMDGTGSYATDPDEWITAFDWDFGDGAAHSSAGWVRHTYEVPGHFIARLTVTDSRGDQDSATSPASRLPSTTSATGPFMHPVRVEAGSATRARMDPGGTFTPM